MERKEKSMNARSGCEGVVRRRETRLGNKDDADAGFGDSCHRAKTTGAWRWSV
jgi:hypothetical protein